MSRRLLLLAVVGFVTTTASATHMQKEEEEKDRSLQFIDDMEVDSDDADADCPFSSKQYSTAYNVLFDLNSSLGGKTCTPREIRKIGKILEKEFDLFLEENYIYDPSIAILSAKTDVCPYTPVIDALRNKRESQDSDDRRRRRLPLSAHIFTYLSTGRCKFCAKDNGDRRGLRHSTTTTTTTSSSNNDRRLDLGEVYNMSIFKVYDYFAKLIEVTQMTVDESLTERLLVRARQKNIECIFQSSGVTVSTTVVIKRPEDESEDNSADDSNGDSWSSSSSSSDDNNDCKEEVNCCADALNPYTCSRVLDQSKFCHSSPQKCAGCGGQWVDPLSPPPCIMEWNTCHPPSSASSSSDNPDDERECCPDTVCHEMMDGVHRCVNTNEIPLLQDTCWNDYRPCDPNNDENECCPTSSCFDMPKDVHRCIPIQDQALFTPTQCIRKHQSCLTRPDDCCNGLTCVHRRRWSRCKRVRHW